MAVPNASTTAAAASARDTTSGERRRPGCARCHGWCEAGTQHDGRHTGDDRTTRLTHTRQGITAAPLTTSGGLHTQAQSTRHRPRRLYSRASHMLLPWRVRDVSVTTTGHTIDIGVRASRLRPP